MIAHCHCESGAFIVGVRSPVLLSRYGSGSRRMLCFFRCWMLWLSCRQLSWTPLATDHSASALRSLSYGVRLPLCAVVACWKTSASFNRELVLIRFFSLYNASCLIHKAVDDMVKILLAWVWVDETLGLISGFFCLNKQTGLSCRRWII